jgi:hypothetical protein
MTHRPRQRVEDADEDGPAPASFEEQILSTQI